MVLIANNITVDFTTTVATTDPLGAGFVCSEFGGSPVPMVGDSTWNAALTALAPGHVRCSIAYYGGSPGYGAGGSARTHGSATALINAIKAMGAIPLVSFNGDSADNNFFPADGGSLVHYFNDGGGQNGGPVKYWSIGNEAENGGQSMINTYEAGTGTGNTQGSAVQTANAMYAADNTVVIGAPAASYWDTGMISWAAANMPHLGGLSYHAYDGGNTDGTGFPTDGQMYTHIHSDLPGYKAGILYGCEEMNWNPSYSGQTQYYDWHNCNFLADNIGQALSAGGHATIYSDYGTALGLMNDGSGNNNQPGAKYTKFPSYWALGIWTGMNGQFKRWGTHMCSATSTFSSRQVTAYASDSGKIVVCNNTTSAQALSIGLTLSGGATSGTYNVWATNGTSPTSAITQKVTGASFSGSVISYTIPAQTVVSIDVTASGGGGTGGGTVTLTQDFEEGTNGTALSAANTAGSGESAFNTVGTSGGTSAFSNTTAAHGVMSAVFSTPAGGGTASVSWGTSLGTQTSIYGRAYVNLTAYPGNDDAVIEFQNAGTFGGGIQIAATGNMRIQDASFAETTSASVIPLNTWVRIEWNVVCGAAGAASATVRYYASMDSTTITETFADTAGPYGSGGSLNTVLFGWNNSHPSQPSMYLDDLAVTTAGWPGPVPTLTLKNDFSEGTNGTVLTPANTAGPGQNAFDVVTAGTGAAVDFSDSQAIHSPLSAGMSTGTTAGIASFSWTTSLTANLTQFYGRVYVMLTAAPGSTDAVIQHKGTGASPAGNIQISTARQIVGQTPGFANAFTFTTVMATFTWYRIEWFMKTGAAGAAQLTVSLYAGDSTTATETHTDTTNAWGGTGGVAEIDFGWTNSHANQPPLFIGPVAVGTGGYFGPAITPSPALPDVAAAVDVLTVTGSSPPPLGAGAATAVAGAVDTLVTTSITEPAASADAAAATDTLTALLIQPVTLAGGTAGVAAAVEALAVTQGTAPPPSPDTTPLPVASPAFIRSQMPRMHVQNLLTGQWLHRDVQGITSPNITWNLNQPDTLTCTLAPPRPDMLDASGNPVIRTWRDAVYLEESDTIRWGGILTGMTVNGPQLQLSATGFAGYAAGIPYDGPAYTEYSVDALDVVRYLWGWLQAQPNSNIGLQVDTARSGVLLGSHVTNLASCFLDLNSYPPDLIPVSTLRTKNVIVASEKTVQRLWFSNASAFAAGMDITIGGTEQTSIAQVVQNSQGVATGAVLVTPLARQHSAGEQVLQVQTHCVLARDAAAGQATVWLGNATGFSAGETILIGTKPYVIGTILTDTTTGLATGQVTLTGNLAEAHKGGELVVQAPVPFQLLWYNTTDVGQEISSIQAEAVFDWHESHTWTDPSKAGVIHRLSFGVPRLGVRKAGLRFAEGENIIQPAQVASDATGFADTIIGIGAGQGNSAIRVVASQLSGRLRRVQVYQDQTATTTARMSSLAAKVLAAALAAVDNPQSIVVKNHPNAPFGSFGPGDDIPVLLASGWKSGTVWCRITAMSQDPTTDLMTLTVARSDSFTYIAQSGQAGTI